MPSWLATVMIRPPPLARSAGSTAWLARKGARRLTAISRSKSATANSPNGLRMRMPALLTRMSMRPNAASAASTMLCTSTAFARSNRPNSARVPVLHARQSAATAVSSSRVESAARYTDAPAAASARAVAAPMPRDAPVTSAVLPFNAAIRNLDLGHATATLYTWRYRAQSEFRAADYCWRRKRGRLSVVRLRRRTAMRELRFMMLFLLVIIFAKALVGAIVRGDGFRIELGDWRRQMIEMAMRIAAAHQQRRQAIRADRAHPRGNVADADADPPVGSPVGRGAMRTKRVEQRQLACFELHRDRVAVLDGLDDDLSGAVDAVLEPCRGVMHLARLAMRRQHVHAARDAARIRQRDPRGDVLVRLEAEVSRVLVPRGKRRGTRVLDEERAPDNEDVGTDHVLDSIEHARVPHELVRPGQVNVRGAAPLELGLLQRRAQVRFRSL